MNFFLKKITLIALALIIIPVSVLAEEAKTNTPSTQLNTKAGDSLNNTFNGTYNPNAVNTTSGGYGGVAIDPNTGQTYLPAQILQSQALGMTGQGTYGINGSTAVSSFGQCIGASGITNVVKNQISKITGGILDPTRVPTGNAVLEGKDTGSIITGGASWDQVGWCIANGLIEAVGDATVAWINSGFQGNPVFVDDPAQFFSDVADIQAGLFLNEVSNGLLCTPIQNWVRVNLASNYNNSLSYAPQCTFSDNALTQFMNGETFSWTDWLNYTQNPYNNPFGATIYSQIELDQRIAAMLNLQQTQLQWNAGFLSKVDPNTGKITSPGSVIEAQVNERLFSGQRRLEIADEFDEVVNALVNQLIKIAITETLEQSN